MKDYAQENLFQPDAQSQATSENVAEGDAHQTAIDIICHQLAIELTADELLPARFRKIKNRVEFDAKRKRERDSETERTFRETVNAFKSTINIMIEKLPADFAWRCINRKPHVSGKESCPADNQDFRQFTEYFHIRRDSTDCTTDETGCLAILTTVFYDAVKAKTNRDSVGIRAGFGVSDSASTLNI